MTAKQKLDAILDHARFTVRYHIEKSATGDRFEGQAHEAVRVLEIAGEPVECPCGPCVWQREFDAETKQRDVERMETVIKKS